MLSNLSWDAIVCQLVKRRIVPDRIHRLCLYGAPGSGKSSIAAHLFPSVERLALFASQPIEDILGAMAALESDGAGGMVARWSDGPAIRAMRAGVPLILDEIDQVSADCRTALHAVLDDLSICRVTLPDGSVVRPAPGFAVFATSNVHPSRLPEALRDRFDLVLRADSPSAGALDAIGCQGLREVTARMVADEQKSQKPFTRALGVRAAIAIDRMAPIVGVHDACCLVLGDADVGQRVAEAVAAQ